MRRHLLHGCALIALLTGVAGAAPVAPLVTASIQPTEISVGESAELTITTSGTATAPVAMPQVQGLEFRIIGQSHRVEIVAGATLVSTALVVRVTPTASGVYTIPGFQPKSDPLILRVNPEGTGGSAALGRLNQPKPRADGIHLSPDGSAFVRLILPKRDVYVGESVPVDIEVGMRDGFVSSLNGLPTLSGADFTLNNLSHQPERAPKLIDGRGFTLLTWHSMLAAVKPGRFSLSVESPLTVRIPTRPARESRLEDALGDPFFQNYFGITVPKDITVASPPAELNVLSLPTEGRPAEFSGAVGSFKIADDLSARSAAAGDPLTLRMHVTGAGNFDRVDSAMLTHLDDWKTYPPKSSFKAADALGNKGEKIFEQPLICAAPGEHTLPALSFSFFDPGTRRYETLHSAPIAVSITPSAGQAPAAPAAASAATAAGAGAAAPGMAGAQSGLRSDHVEDASRHSSLVPPYLEARFMAIPLGVSLAFAGTWLVRRRAHAASGRARRAALAAERTLEELEAAAHSGNPVQFFTAARRALQGIAGLDPATESEEIRRIFNLADEASYSGGELSITDFDRWMACVRQRLQGRLPT